MSAYRFCRTDDIGLLVDALNRCWAPYFPNEPPATPETFKQSIRDLQVWCSSCMVAFSGADPIGVLIGAKRPSGTLIHKIAVHPVHRRQGHGRHLLTSLSSKLAILGPPRIVAEVPENLAAACGLFGVSGYVQAAHLTDYVLRDEGVLHGGFSTSGSSREVLHGEVLHGEVLQAGRFVIPVTVEDLAANGLLEADRPVCWERSVETLTARKADIAGLAVASDERIEASILYLSDGHILSLRSYVDDSGTRVKQLLAELCARGVNNFRLPKAHPEEISQGLMEMLGFRAAGRYLLYTARARAE
jgi:GNAT superfamily N-acetyltransferase